MSDWQELVIEGARQSARAFVRGFAAARGERRVVYVGDDLGSSRRRSVSVCGRCSGPGRITSSSSAALATPRGRCANTAPTRDCGWSVPGTSIPWDSLSCGSLLGGRGGGNSRRARRVAPPGVRIDGLSESEEKHPEAHGAELFAPLHEYTYRASGRIVGVPDAVIRIWKDARKRDFVEIGALHIDAKD
jgi:hypothetical protein